MSTGYNCFFFEATPGHWFYVLQDWSCPVGAWDWTEHASVVGPFATDEAAIDYLSEHEANPGSYHRVPHNPKDDRANARHAELAAKARAPRSSRDRYAYGIRW